MEALGDMLDAIADETRFAGVYRVDAGDDVIERAFGLADRRNDIHNTTDTRLSIASGTKGFTALAVMALVESGELRLDAPIRPILRDDLPLIDDAVTVEHLLTHRSGIGDYLDESELDDITAYVMPIPAHEMWGTEQYVPALDGHPQVGTPDERFAYNNSGFVVLALVAERVSGQRFDDLVSGSVCGPAGLSNTGFELSDQLPADIALGYLAVDGLRTNVFHLPVIGSGDGGIFSTTADMRRFWLALFDGRIVGNEVVTAMTTPRSDVPDAKMRYGMGFWLAPAGPQVVLEGADAGVSFRSVHDPTTDTTHTVVSNTSGGAWPIATALIDWFGPTNAAS